MKLFCLPQKELNNFGKTDDYIGGFFIANAETMVLSDSSASDPTLICHEFTHADIHFLHNSQTCHSTHDNAVIPVYPVNRETMKKYSNALDLGDRRIQEFEYLHTKQTSGIKLTAREKKLYEIYSRATKDCLPHKMVDPISQAKYKKLKAQQAQTTKKDLILEKNGYSVRIIDLIHAKATGKYYVIEEMIDPALSILGSHRITMKRVTNNPIYKNQPPIKKLAERDAYTFAHLSTLARKIFYKEAHKIRESFFERCSPKEISTPTESISAL